jgi:alcohol dehydrogenase class IV
VIVRWGLRSLPEACVQAGVASPLLVASGRWDALELTVAPAARWTEVPSDRIAEAVAAARDADGVLAVGGGSAIDLGKAISAATASPLVSVPTTYAGAEWTSYFGVRDSERRMQGGGGGALPVAIVYEPALTLELSVEATVGTAMNALAHCAEALYVRGHNPAADEEALAGARLIAEWLPPVVSTPDDLEARTQLLRGACHGGAALAGAMLGLAHAMAQAIGGRYGLPHGTLNGICLPTVLRFNTPYAPDAVARFGEAIGNPDDPAGRVEALTALAGPTRLRDLGVPEDDLPGLAASAAERGGNLANPRPASPDEIEQLLREAY